MGSYPSKLRIELEVKNEGRKPVRLQFSTSGRVCGVIHDSKNRPYYHFPQATAQVVGTEIIPAGKKRTFRTEVPQEELARLRAGFNAVAAWLCGYEGLRAWAEFHMPVPSRD